MAAAIPKDIIAPLSHRHVKAVKKALREVQNDLHYQYEFKEKEAEARFASDRSNTYLQAHPELVAEKTATIKPTGTKKKVPIGPFLGFFARTYTSDASNQSIQTQLKKKIKSKSMRIARRMRMSESEYSGHTTTLDEDDPANREQITGQEIQDGEEDEEDDDDESKEVEGGLAMIEETQEEDIEEEDDDDEDDEAAGTGRTGTVVEDEEDDDDDDDDIGQVDEEEEEEEDEEVEDEEDDEEEPIIGLSTPLPRQLCIKAIQRLIEEEDL